MTTKAKQILAWAVSIALFLGFGNVLLMYTQPMEDVFLDLSLITGEVAAEAAADSRNWTVYTQTGEAVTELESNGQGSYRGIQLGQTFYFSRVMEEELDSPTLQIGTADRKFSVWLDEDLIYTDCPELDNRIGYVTLPMNQWDRTEPIIISLPLDYQGKTLTIAQSSPEFAEGSSPMAVPASVKLYCGYAYESGLITESYRSAFSCILIFTVGVLLLLAFLRSHKPASLCMALTAFVLMSWMVMNTSFYYHYFGRTLQEIGNLIPLPLFMAGALLFFLYDKAGQKRKPLLVLMVLYWISFLIAAILTLQIRQYTSRLQVLFAEPIPEWIGFFGLTLAIVQGILFWRKENRFYRLFLPLALAGIALYWLKAVADGDDIALQIRVSLESGIVSYVYYKMLYPALAAALVSAVVDAARTEIDHRLEKQLLEERRELTLKSYEHIRRQHEEVMMLRHDMVKHFVSLQALSSEPQVQAYLEDLIGQNQKIRPVVQTGNEIMDIILGAKLAEANQAGITVEVVRAGVPGTLPLSDADLCSLMMNILDNSIAGASRSGAGQPLIRLDIHVKNCYLIITCENSAGSAPEGIQSGTAVQKHGLGLKIIQRILERCQGLFDAESRSGSYKVSIAVPLPDTM